jgi:signal peptidase I
MSKTKKPAKPRDVPKTPAAVQAAAAPPQPKSHAFRETVESIVIAFVLAFLFRTFEAEAFVIPTGSMAPTLMGRHKDVDCPKCGYRYQVSASEEAPENPQQAPSLCLAGMCPMCGYLQPMVPSQALPSDVVERQLPDLEYKRSYNGDRILVNKYDYTLNSPQRWDVVVFKYPEDAKVNYIKRLVGLPGEKLRVYQGDLFVGANDAHEQSNFEIARKPSDKVLAMRQLVHDTDYDAAELDEAGWPLRWSAAPGDGEGWKVDKTIEDINVRQRYTVDTTGKSDAWLQYNHFTPTYNTWREIIESTDNEPLPAPQPKLITDANPYNARVHGFEYEQTKFGRAGRLAIDPRNLGLHWVGDLMLEADVEVESAEGQLLLELVEAGKAFRATIDFKTGEATLSAPGDDSFAPKAKTSITGPGNYHIGFSNFDDQLLLWIDGETVEFDVSTAYDAAKVFGDRREIIPHTSDEDPGDFAPARIGASNGKIAVDRLQLWRDIYYIAGLPGMGLPMKDLAISDIELEQLSQTPSQWDLYKERRHVDFPLDEDQFFVMGDNSAESSDARFWGDSDAQGEIHGQYLERRLLIGKALSVYWPHSWNRIPGTPIPFPLFPNFEDMRLVR